MKHLLEPVCCTTPDRTRRYHRIFWTFISFAGFWLLLKFIRFQPTEFSWSKTAGFSWRTLGILTATAVLVRAFRRLPFGRGVDETAREGAAAAWMYFTFFFTLFFAIFSPVSPLESFSDGTRRAWLWFFNLSVLLVFAPRLLRWDPVRPLAGAIVLSLWPLSYVQPWLMFFFWPLALWGFFEFLEDLLIRAGFWRTGLTLALGLGAGFVLAHCFVAMTTGFQWTAFLAPLAAFAPLALVSGKKPVSPAPPASWSFPWSGAALVVFLAMGAAVILLPSVHAARAVRHELRHGGPETVQTPFPHIRDTADGHLHVEVDSKDVPQSAGIKGYAGPVGVVMRFDAACTLEWVRLGTHNETPSFVKKFSPWLSKFAGFPASRSVLDEIDTVSGATLSTRAIRQAVHEVRSRVCTEILHVKTDTRLVQGPRDSWHDAILPAFFLLIAVFLWFFLSNAGRILLMIASFAVLGFVHNFQLSLVDAGLLVTGVLPSSLAKRIFLFAALGGALFLGPLWCSFLCPVGAAQEILHMLSRLVRGEKLWQLARTGAMRPDPRSLPVLAAQSVKYLLLGGSLAIFGWTLDQRFLGWDPLSFLFALPPQSWILYLAWAAGIGLPSLVLYRPWCRFACPFGALLMLMGKFAFLGRFFPVRKLKDCDFGTKSVHDLHCIRCQRCCTSLLRKNPAD